MRRFLYNLATDKYKGVIPAAIKFLLFLFSLIYGLTVRVLILSLGLSAYRSTARVISVGNITLGGTGKTPLVELIAKFLRGEAHRVAVVTRGYKKLTVSAKICGGDSSQSADWKGMGDEAFMLSQKLGEIPVIVDSDRIKGIERAIKDYGVDTVILDDGLQQWRIKKDLEIVTVDAANPLGNRHMLPRGILREPLSSLKRADIFVLTKSNLNPGTGEIKDFLNRLKPGALIIEASHEPLGFFDIGTGQELFSPELLKGKTVTLFSGIGDPASFENLIVAQGIKVGLSFRFEDHHDYSKQDLDRIARESEKKGINAIITTDKDAVRLRNFRLAASNLRLLSFAIRIAIKDEQKFYNRLRQLYSF